MTIKKILLFISSLFIATTVFSQASIDSIWRKDLIGIWQRGTPVTGNGYNQIYIFYPDGSYELRTNSWEETLTNYGFVGHYKIKKGTQTLTLTIDSTYEGRDCNYVYGDNPGGSADWQLHCKTGVTLYYKNPENTFEILIEWAPSDKKFEEYGLPLTKCILMDKAYQYYKVSDKTEVE